MHSITEARQFVPIKAAVMTISDSRTEETDVSGKVLIDGLLESGHCIAEKLVIADDIYKIREVISRWIADESVQVVLTTGGTGVTERDVTPEAVQPLLNKEIHGFGQLFRWVSYAEINSSTIQSRALAGVANATYLFCLPGSSGACRTGWEKIIKNQLDYRTRPCNLVELMPRLKLL